ncbi:MAG TPA: glycoside hydrolase family 28 protein [Bryobacteraceae bacterium]
MSPFPFCVTRRSVLGAAIALCPAVLARTAEFRVTDFGAKGDGKAVDTEAIQRAIDNAAKSKGAVTFRPGVYRTGALFLRSGVRFQIDEGVTIRGVQDLLAYPEMPTRVAGVEMTWPAALINVYQQSDVSISGRGKIDGDGKFWWDRYWRLRKEYEPKGLRWAADYDCKRVRLIQIYKSSNINVQDLTLERSGFWTVHVCYSQHVHVHGITICNNIGGRGPSTDGIDIDSSSNVLAERCDIDCNDDALCLKAGRDADGLRVNRPTENVVIRDCTIRGGAAGVTVGSETSGGIRNVKVSGLRVLAGVPYGIYFKSAKTRGGTVENIEISNLQLEGVATPIGVTMNWNPSYSYAQLPAGMTKVPSYWKVLTEPVPPAKGLPHFHDVRISDVYATNAKRAFQVSAFPGDPLERFSFDRLTIRAKTAGTIADADDWTFHRTEIATEDGSRVSLRNCRNIKGLPES